MDLGLYCVGHLIFGGFLELNNQVKIFQFKVLIRISCSLFSLITKDIRLAKSSLQSTCPKQLADYLFICPVTHYPSPLILTQVYRGVELNLADAKDNSQVEFNELAQSTDIPHNFN